LRHYYPAEYYAALFNSQPMGFYPPHVLIGDAKRHDIQVLRVGINRSSVRCIAGEGHVLLGLTTVRSLGEDLARAIVDEREASGPYRSLTDLLRRTGLPSTVAENLIAVGALSEFGLSRRELLWQLGLLRPDSKAMRAALRGAHGQRQLTLDLLNEQDMAQLRDMEEWERMVADYGQLGLSPCSAGRHSYLGRAARCRRWRPSSYRRARGLQAAPRNGGWLCVPVARG
jgi:error-prone DNA polymerase